MVRTTLDGLRKEYDDVVAANDVTLTLEDGEFLVLLGPSGCGKSTTLRMLAGLESPTAGEIRVDGEVVNRQGPSRRDFAMVFQEVALYPHMSVQKNISSPLRAAGVDGDTIDDRVTQTAALLNIEELLDRQPNELSGGQQQRVAIGRALVREPRAFLLDEPFSNLDQKLRTQLQKELKRLQDRMNVTTVFVTHDQEEAMVLADRIAVMEQGTLQQVDTPEQLYRHPANEFVAKFIGNPTMNFFEIEATDGTSTIDGVDYDLGELESHERFDSIHRMAARPEDIIPNRDPPDGQLSGRIDLVEMRGSTTYLIVEHGGTEITVLQPTEEHFEEGEEVGLSFVFDKISFFDYDGELVRLNDSETASTTTDI